MAIPQNVLDICYQATDKQRHHSIMARSKMFNTGEMFQEKCKINLYKIAYRYLLVVALSLGRKVNFFSQKAVKCLSLYCAHFTVYACGTFQQ